jgi:thymidylate kinase
LWFLELLRAAGVRTCSWKSNWKLELRDENDVEYDLLVLESDRTAFRTVAGKALAVPLAVESTRADHLLLPDPISWRVIHLHVYYGLLTGGSLVKTHKLPFEGLLLAGDASIDGIPVPPPAAELGTFIVRKALESSSLLELMVLRREGPGLTSELEWLQRRTSDVYGVDWLNRHVAPSLPQHLVHAFGRALEARSLTAMYRHGRQIAAHLNHLRATALHGTARLRLAALLKVAAAKVRRHPVRLARPVTVVALVGGEASGKSTVVSNLVKWLHPVVGVEAVHAGKPPSTLLSFLPNTLLPLVRRLLPSKRTNAIEVSGATDESGQTQSRGLLYVIRSALIAHDQASMLRRVFRHSNHGTVVICDRYPSGLFGGMDGPRVRSSSFAAGSLKARVARHEEESYASIPLPAVVLKLEVPVDVAVARNASRHKADPESESYVRARHSLMTKWALPGAVVVPLDTNTSFAAVQSLARRHVWQALHDDRTRTPGDVS